MLKLNVSNKAFETLIQSGFKTENILERYDFQAAMVKSWEIVKNEIGLPTSYLIGEEINPHKSVGNSIDLLAFNPDDSSLVVIELKRDKNKLQLLQSLSYASMIAQWDKETLISKIQRPINPESSELVDLINNNELNNEVKIILISELFDPEVIITTDWLNNYGLNITAFSVSVHKLEEQIFVSFEQRLPLKELADVYEERGRKANISRKKSSISWEEVLPKLKYKFAAKALELCRKEKEGEPSRRRFGNIRSNYDGFDWISINFREKYLNIYIKGEPENAKEFLKSKFSDSLEILQWQEGYSFKIDKEKQFDELAKWMKLGQK
jgi:hypothetical protein